MYKVYNIGMNVCGVYLIINKLNGFKYVGSSVNIASRICNHFHRDARNYPKKRFYSDILKYGIENFEWKILERCDKDKRIEREQYYYDTLKPEYNEIRPCENNFKNVYVRQKAIETCSTPEFRAKKSEQYRSEYYRNLFSSIQDKRKRKVDMYKNNIYIMTFDSLCDCQEWLNNNTTFSGKNKCSKIKAVCDGERHSAYGYTFKYNETSND